MPIEDQALGELVEDLSERIRGLESRVATLSQRVCDLEGKTSRPSFGALPRAATADEDSALLEGAEGVSEEAITWAGRASILPRIAAISFLLVVALVLRTIADSGLVTKMLGQILGMGYAAALMIVGWNRYAKKSALAPVIAACGAVLMSTIVVETHMHFQSLPLVPAYLTLIATGIAMALMSRRFNAFMPVSVGILGMCLAGAAMDWPHPFFPYVALVLFTANLLGFFAGKLKRCSWLRWTAFAVTMFMLVAWGVELGAQSRGAVPPPNLALDWYLPVLVVFFLTFLGLPLVGIFQAGASKASKFDISLPPLNAIWAFAGGLALLLGGGSTRLLGLAGLVLAIAHFGLAFFLQGRKTADRNPVTSFILAGGILLGFSLPFAFGSFTLTLPLVSLTALLLGMKSRTWGSGGIRSVGYLMQLYASGALTLALVSKGTDATIALNLLPTFAVAALAIWHYDYSRRFPPPSSSVLFSSVDSKDRSAVLLLLIGALCAVHMVRIGVDQLVSGFEPAARLAALDSAQTVFINFMAMCLMIFALIRRDKELRNVAILVTFLGAFKVFLFDMLSFNGLPLVFSVFSFGLAAAVESVVLGKWPKARETDGSQGENQGLEGN